MPLMCPVALDVVTGSCPSMGTFSSHWLHASSDESREHAQEEEKDDTCGDVEPRVRPGVQNPRRWSDGVRALLTKPSEQKKWDSQGVGSEPSVQREGHPATSPMSSGFRSVTPSHTQKK
jgi:hypothetical protein